MPFLIANIDRAIVMTQYDLRGFVHPLGFRQKEMTGKTLDAITGNFVAFAIGLGNERGPTVAYTDYFESSFEEYLAMCKQFAEACDLSEKEAIQLLIREIMKKDEEMKAEVAAKKRDPDGYLRPIDESNRWGRAILALVEAFDIPIHSKQAAT